MWIMQLVQSAVVEVGLFWLLVCLILLTNVWNYVLNFRLNFESFHSV